MRMRGALQARAQPAVRDPKQRAVTAHQRARARLWRVAWFGGGTCSSVGGAIASASAVRYALPAKLRDEIAKGLDATGLHAKRGDGRSLLKLGLQPLIL